MENELPRCWDFYFLENVSWLDNCGWIKKKMQLLFIKDFIIPKTKKYLCLPLIFHNVEQQFYKILN